VGRLLDVGCFPGHLALCARQFGWQVTGLGIRGFEVGDAEFAKRMHTRGIDVVQADVERDPFPFADETFDAALFTEVIEHLAFNPFHPLDKIWRVLRPGGILVFSTPNLVSFDHRWAFLRGRTIYPPLTAELALTFPADFSQRHVREYTPQELRYILEDQSKYLYQYQTIRLCMDRRRDTAFSDAGPMGWRSLRPGRLFRDILTRIFPRLRSQIIVLAQKPTWYTRLRQADITATGFYPPEQAATSSGGVRRPVEAQWSKPEAWLSIDVSHVLGKARKVEALMWLPAPSTVPPREVKIFAHSRLLGSVVVPPGNEPQRRVLVAKSAGLVTQATSRLEMQITCAAWSPHNYGFTGDRRSLGVMMDLNQIAVVSG